MRADRAFSLLGSVCPDLSVERRWRRVRFPRCDGLEDDVTTKEEVRGLADRFWDGLVRCAFQYCSLAEQVRGVERRPVRQRQPYRSARHYTRYGRSAARVSSLTRACTRVPDSA